MSGPRIFYEDADCTLWLGDCRDVLPRLEPLTLDLLIADPPYGVKWEGRGTQRFGLIENDDGSFDLAAALTAALRILKRGAHVYVFGPEPPPGLPLCITSELIWDKELVGLGDLSLPWGPSHERITFAVHQTSKANRDDGFGRLTARIRRGSVLRYPRPNAAAVTRHPTEKPVGLLRELIESSTVFGEAVLDPFAGSGSTLVAAKLEGRRSIGIEIDERYCEVAARRLAQQVLPLEVPA